MLSQKKLADLSGLGVAIISRYERGQAHPRGRNLVALANALGCTASWLQFGTNDQKQREVRIEINLPESLYDRIVDSADERDWSLDYEITKRLEQSFKQDAVYEVFKASRNFGSKKQVITQVINHVRESLTGVESALRNLEEEADAYERMEYDHEQLAIKESQKEQK